LEVNQLFREHVTSIFRAEEKAKHEADNKQIQSLLASDKELVNVKEISTRESEVRQASVLTRDCLQHTLLQGQRKDKI
jgi:hypothetical protein